MTGDEAISPVRALRPLPPADVDDPQGGPEGLRVDLEGGAVDVLLRVSPHGRRHDNLVLLGEPRAATAEALAGLLPEAHVVAPSMGDLGWPPSRSEVRASSARAVVRLMDHFAIERAVLVGTEVGADLAVAVASAHPDRVGALVLINGGLGDSVDDEQATGDHAAAARDALSGLRVPVAVVFGGSVAESIGYTASSVTATTSWLRHVEAQEVDAGEHGCLDVQAFAVVAEIVETQLASVRARAAHPATGSHRIISPADDED